MSAVQFVKFYFELSKTSELIKSESDWRRIVSRLSVSDKTNLMETTHASIQTGRVEEDQVAPDKDYLPSFGYSDNHRAKLTLGEWAKKTGMWGTLTRYLN